LTVPALAPEVAPVSVIQDVDVAAVHPQGFIDGLLTVSAKLKVPPAAGAFCVDGESTNWQGWGSTTIWEGPLPLSQARPNTAGKTQNRILR
jgi:hypothetical protein